MCSVGTKFKMILNAFTDKLRLTTSKEGKKRQGKKRVANGSDDEKTESKKVKIKGKFKDTPEDRVQAEMKKVAALQARIAKKKNRPHKLRTLTDNENTRSGSKLGNISVFVDV